MASDLPALWLAVLDRVTSDTGTGGLLNVTTPLLAGSGIYNTQAPSTEGTSSVYPYIVYATASSQNDSEFETRGWIREIDFHIYVEKSSSSITDPMQRGADILRRLEGDWEDQPAGTQPSFGFDRYKPSLGSSGWTPDIFELIDSRDLHEDEVYHWMMTFRIRNSKRRA